MDATVHKYISKDVEEEKEAQFVAMKKKTIITIRHTESEHHVKGMTGGVSYWNLTDLGKEQAYKVGKK